MSKSKESNDNRATQRASNLVADLQQQVAELTDALQRERADAINLRRRTEEERVKLATFYKATVVRELLPIVDNFERALKQAPSFEGERTADSGQRTAESDNSTRYTLNAKRLEDYVRGVQGIVKQFEKTLGSLGVERIKTVGEVFDPKFHEAVSMDDSEDGEHEVVSEELQAGYRLGDEVIRHAMVKVRMQ